MPPRARCQTDSTTATIALLRTLAALGPRLHEPLTSADPGALYELVCTTLRDCQLHAHIGELADSGELRIVATSIESTMRAFIEHLIGTSFIGYPIARVGPYAEALAGTDAVVIERVADILEPIVPQLTPEQRDQLAHGAAADRALLAPILARGRVRGVLSVWGPRRRLSREDAPAVMALAAQVGIAAENARLFREGEAERARWRATVEDLADLVVVCDAEGRLTYFNASARRVFGAPDPSLGPEALSDHYGLLHPDGAPFALNELPLQEARLTGQPVPPTSVVLRDADGSERHLVWTASPLRGPGGAIEGATAVGRDLTREELLERQSYSALRVILHLAEIATAPGEVPTPAALLARIVEALLGLGAVGYAHAMLVDEDVGRLRPIAIGNVSPAIVATWREEIEAFQLAEVPSLQRAIDELHAGRVLRQDLTQQAPLLTPQTVREIGVRAAITAPVLDDGRLIGLLTLGRTRPPDLARQSIFAPFDEELLLGAARLAGQALTRARLAATLTATEAARLAAEAATRQRDVFLSIASHELRTPLTSLKTLVYLLQRRSQAVPRGASLPETPPSGARGTSTEELLDRIARQTDRLVRLVDDLLETSRIDTGHLELLCERADLGALVRQTVEEQRQVNPARTIIFRAPPGPLWVNVDTDRIGQVIANYLTNALKYSPADQPVLVTTRIKDGMAYVAVRDHGPGVPAGERELVWQRFHRVPSTEVLSGSGIGLGIGLYISKTFVERHGGSVGVGEGARRRRAFLVQSAPRVKRKSAFVTKPAPLSRPARSAWRIHDCGALTTAH